MKIAIFDISRNHYPYLYTQCKVFEHDELTLFVHESLKKSIDSCGIFTDKMSISILENEKNKIKYIKRTIKEINNSNFDYIIFNTIQADWFKYLYIFSIIKKNQKIILSMHNINVWMEPLVFFTNPKNFITRLIRKIILKRVDVVNVYGNTMKNYLKSKKWNKPVTTIPFSFYQNKEAFRNENFKIAIPGTFDVRRRDYNTLLRILKSKKIQNITIVLLGRPVGKESMAIFEEYKSLLNVIYYESYVSEEEFQKQMLGSSAILGPTVNEIYMHGVKENYGVSKESGVSFMAIEYNLPLIVPKEIKPMSEIEEITSQYRNDEELLEIIEKLVNNKISNKEFRYLRNYFSVSEIRKRFEREILGG